MFNDIVKGLSQKQYFLKRLGIHVSDFYNETADEMQRQFWPPIPNNSHL